MKSGTWMLRLYPQAWRARYEEEMTALLEQHTVTLATRFDLLLGALDARLNPAYRSTTSFFLFKDERMVATTFLCAYAMFLFAMYNWHHYIPLSLSLTPYYMDMAIRSTPNSVLPFVGSQEMSSETFLSTSDFVLQVTMLLCNVYFIILFVKQAHKAGRKRFLLPAACCLILLFALPVFPLLGMATPRVALSNPYGIIIATEIRPFDQVVQLYTVSLRLLWPLLSLLITSLFIAIIRIRQVIASSQRLWLLLVMLLYLILPLGRMLWLSTSVQIPSPIIPPSSFALGATLTYFPPFAGLATMVVVLAGTKGSRSMLRIALVPASALSLVMLTKLIMTLIILPLIYRSTLSSVSSWSDSLSAFTLITMLFIMFLAGGMVLLALLRGFVILKTTNPFSESDMKPSFT